MRFSPKRVSGLALSGGALALLLAVRRAPANEPRHAPGQRHHGPARAHADRGGAARPCRCGPRRADPRTGDWHRPEDRLRAGRRRPGEAAALQDRSGAVQGRLRSSHRPAQAGAGQSVQRQGAGRSLRAAGQGQRGQQAGIRQRRGVVPPGRGCRGRRQGRAGQRLDQPRLHRRDLAHHRTHRQAAGHRGRAGRGHLGHADGHGAAARPHLYRLQPVHHGPGGAASRLRQRQAAAGRQGRRPRHGGAGGRFRVSAPGKLLFTGITVDPTTGQVNLRAGCRTRRTCCCRACMCA